MVEFDERQGHAKPMRHAPTDAIVFAQKQIAIIFNRKIFSGLNGSKATPASWIPGRDSRYISVQIRPQSIVL